MLDQLNLWDFLVEDCNESLPFLSQLIESILFLLLYINWLSTSCSWQAKMTHVSIRGCSGFSSSSFVHVSMESSLCSLFLIKFEVSLLQVFGVRAVVLVVQCILSKTRNLVRCQIWVSLPTQIPRGIHRYSLLDLALGAWTHSKTSLTLESVDKAGDSHSNDLGSLFGGVSVTKWVNILDAIDHIICQGFKEIWLVFKHEILVSITAENGKSVQCPVDLTCLSWFKCKYETLRLGFSLG